MREIDGNLVAILGPTNTGKTYLAFDRLLSYQSGIFGFPLRLLARENYDKAVKKIGINNVALITGEEKFIPKEAKYFFFFLESIPKNLDVECVAINSVYEIAENLRSHRGGAAVVLGSLSPRTRNAQVEIYEEKKVDYLVATDAIGMGLNLNIDHVAFSSLEKFDGRYKRNLHANEIGQIAGRAGRFQNNGFLEV